MTSSASLGAQSIGRAAQLLRLIAAHPTRGARVVDLAAEAGVTQPTVHRLLKALGAEGLVTQEAATRRYRIGPLAFELGLAAHHHAAIIDRCRDTMERIAEKTGDTVYLVVRHDREAVCLERIVGSYPIKAMVLEVGGRRPLGVGAAGLALLAALPDDAIADVITANAPALSRFGGLDAERLRKAAARARRDGYGVSEGLLTPGVGGIGLAIPTGFGAPYAALSVAAVSSRLEEPRRSELAALLRREIGKLSRETP